MRKKRFLNLIIIIFLISPIIISIWTVPNTNTFIRNDDQEDSTELKIETPKLSNGHSWIIDGVAISTDSDYGDKHNPQILSDGQGGVLIAWDNPSSGIYAQKIDFLGEKQWLKNGVPVSIAGDYVSHPEICSDGAGGMIISWLYEVWSSCDIYAQRINSDGNAQWIENGIVVSNATNRQSLHRICSDGAGGAIIAWQDNRNGYYDIYAQRINSIGNTQWVDNGTAICTSSDNQENPKICSDGAGGAIITWEDHRTGWNDGNIYAQRINSVGNTQWVDNGTAICTSSYNQMYPEICSDGVGGAIITWDDRSSSNDIFAQRINSVGITQWINNGTVVCTATSYQYYPKICSDGAQGAIIAWEDSRNGNYDIYAQRINSIGTIQWTTDGVAITTAFDDQRNLQISSDGEGGAVATWVDYRNSNYDIYAQKVNSNGITQWFDDGTAICRADDHQQYPQICAIEEGSAIITWVDSRGSYDEIYAQRVFEYTGDAEITLITPESKLYTEPMSSYYPATFGFESDEIGDDPDDWSVDNVGGTVQIISSYSGHSNVVELHEMIDASTEIYNDFGSRTSGIVEWWVSVNRVDDWFGLGIYNGDSNDGIHMSFANDSYIKYHDGNIWTDIKPYSANLWYHFKVEWNTATDWHLWINQTSQDQGSGYSYRNSPSSLDRVRFQISTDGEHQDQYMYADAVGYSFDPNYNLGDNLYEGLFIGFELNSSLYTLEYSLDNQANETIPGNTTILLPHDGPHSIRLYGTTFYRDFVQSETRNFIVDTKVPKIVIHSPIQSDTAGEKPPFILFSITEVNLVSKWYTIDDSIKIYGLSSSFDIVDADAWLATPLGQVTIRIYAEDIAGNIVYEEVTITKEGAAMSVSLIFNIAIISMFAVIGVIIIWVFKEISIPRER